uniref:Legume lectin domain-containing protein n=1 Tax=Ananas comosus var. bracteatus TaxID=296719 RepID=A0A6V7NX57_ANACO|nr:unnamed protein product [Ananas comosus var. bracteatus]
MSPPLSLLLLLLILLLPFPSSSCTIVAFDFPSFSLRNLTLLGSSSLLLGSISLIHPPSSSSSSGAAVLSLPVPFADPATNASTSFSTAFSFSITNPCPNPTHGDGLAFFLSADPLPFGAPGLHLGIFNASAFPPPDPPAIVAVEFDTLPDEGFNEPSPNHVGFESAPPNPSSPPNSDPTASISPAATRSTPGSTTPRATKP